MKETRQNIIEELREISPELAVFKETPKPASELPPGYFDDLKQSILSKTAGTSVDVRNERPRFHPRFLKRFYYAISAAAAVIIIISAVLIFQNKTEEAAVPTFAQLTEDLDGDELLALITENIDEFDEEIIMENAVIADDNFMLELENETNLEEILDEEFLDEIDDYTLEEML